MIKQLEAASRNNGFYFCVASLTRVDVEKRDDSDEHLSSDDYYNDHPATFPTSQDISVCDSVDPDGNEFSRRLKRSLPIKSLVDMTCFDSAEHDEKEDYYGQNEDTVKRLYQRTVGFHLCSLEFRRLTSVGCHKYASKAQDRLFLPLPITPNLPGISPNSSKASSLYPWTAYRHLHFKKMYDSCVQTSRVRYRGS